MKIVNLVVVNWFLVVALAAALGASVWVAVRFAGLPTEKQKEKIRNWLIWACIEAERKLQSDTGQLKLREVWNMFCAVPVFTAVAKFIPFKRFSEWVKEALILAKEMLIKNENLAQYVYGNNADKEIEKLRKQLADAKNKEEYPA